MVLEPAGASSLCCGFSQNSARLPRISNVDSQLTDVADVNQRNLIAFDADRAWMEGGRASAAIAVALIDGSKPPLSFEKLPLILIFSTIKRCL